jgi:hypothetical protein
MRGGLSTHAPRWRARRQRPCSPTDRFGGLRACGGVGIDEGAAALVGGQSGEANEASAMTAARVAHFGSGMTQTEAGMAAFSAWLAVVARGH